MGKLGTNWSYPYIKVSRAFEIAGRICGSPYNGEISVSGLAQELGLKERTGGFSNLAKSLKDYGLVAGRGDLKATELAKKIVVGTAEEQSASKAESFLKIGLFGEIHKRIGTNVPEKQRFSTLLGEITKADRLEITNKASTIRNLYLDGCRFLKQQKKPESEELGMESSDQRDQIDKSTAIPGVVLGKLSTAEYGTFIFKDKASIDVARKILDLIEIQLNGEQETEATSEEEG